MVGQEPHLKKKLIVCCDGTWMNSDRAWVKEGWWWWDTRGSLQTPSNVTRIGRAILAEDKNHCPQIVYYQAGIGTGFGLADKYIGGGTGEGISEHIREAYSFLANNYLPGDEIFLLGFSRGAFTARSIAGLIGSFGLLSKEEMPHFYDVFKDWENAGAKRYHARILKSRSGFILKTRPSDAQAYLREYKQTLLNLGMTKEVTIKAIGVWDTVGALGIPTTSLMQMFGFSDFLREYKFLDTGIDNHVENAFQAMALDERRLTFSPTVWEKPSGCRTNLKQVWFPGVHANVGGSYKDTSMADITLAWMMSQFSPWIDFNPDYLPREVRANQALETAEGRPASGRGYALGTIYNSAHFPTNRGGTGPRTPCRYSRTDCGTGRRLAERLIDTNEYVHASVRARMFAGGLGYEDSGLYLPEALADWELAPEHRLTDGKFTVATSPALQNVRWHYKGSDKNIEGGGMMEDEIGKFELDLLEIDPLPKKDLVILR